MVLPLLSDGRTGDQDDLARTVHDLLARTIGTATSQDRGLWKRLTSDIGVAGFCLSEDQGGVGASLGDLSALHQELGYWIAGADIAAHHLAVTVLASSPDVTGRELKSFAAGSVRGAAHVPAIGSESALTALNIGENIVLSGEIPEFVSAAGADTLVVWAIDERYGDGGWFALNRADLVSCDDLQVFDPSRRVAHVRLVQAAAVRLTLADPQAVLDRIRRLSAFLHASESVGGARRCLELAVDHAKTRKQFDRPIGSFQAIKHQLADGLVRLERARATLAAACSAGIEGPLTLPATQRLSTETYVRASQELIQVLGGLGFTWEHEAHRHLRRSASTRNLVPVLPVDREPQHQPPIADDEFSARVRSWFEDNGVRTATLSPAERRMDDTRIGLARQFQSELAEAGFAGLTWPTACGGRGLGPQEFYDYVRATDGFDTYADVTTISLGIIGPLLIDLGTGKQRETYLSKLLRLDALWCQLFSEPGSGSDLAGVRTKATKVGDTFVIDGQKVWTTNAHLAQFGLLLARTDSSVAKHRGLTMFILDMAAPGVQVRPITQITGEKEFCEVFLDGVEIPADQVLGEVDGGWSAALAALTYERITLGSGAYKELAAGAFDKLLTLAETRGLGDDPLILAQLDELRVQEVGLDAFTARIALEVSLGHDPGPAASISKLLTATLAKDAADLGLRIGGPSAVAWARSQPDGDDLTFQFLYAPSTTIAGGTDQVQRNIIGEQLLGLPREPRVDKAHSK